MLLSSCCLVHGGGEALSKATPGVALLKSSQGNRFATCSGVRSQPVALRLSHLIYEVRQVSPLCLGWFWLNFQSPLKGLFQPLALFVVHVAREFQR
jgi:hypothetical protein